MCESDSGDRGEHEISRSTIAQGVPDCFGVPVVTCSCAFFICTRGCGCGKHPAFPAPLFFEGHVDEQLGRIVSRECRRVPAVLICGPSDELFEIRIRKSGRPSQARPQRDRVLATPDNPSRGGSFARHARGFLTERGRHHPRKRMIQYAMASRLKRRVVITGYPLSRV